MLFVLTCPFSASLSSSDLVCSAVCLTSPLGCLRASQSELTLKWHHVSHPGPLLQRPWHVVGLAGARVVLVPLPSSPQPGPRHEVVRHAATGVPELLAAPHP